MKRSQPRRDWTAAREKVEREGRCRIEMRLVYGITGTCAGPLEAAHIIGRECDEYVAAWAIEMETLDVSQRPKTAYATWRVDPDRIVPLCHKHHRAYDDHELDLLGYLTPEEEAQAVLDAGSLESARRRLCPSEYRRQAA